MSPNFRPLADPAHGLAHTISHQLFKMAMADEGMFPDLRAGSTIFVASDYGGEHQSATATTYSFVIASADGMGEWFSLRERFRREIIKDHRRMAYKKLGEPVRAKALRPFLNMANRIPGVLITISIHRDVDTLFQAGSVAMERSIFPHWAESSFQKLLTVVHLLSLFVSGLSAPGQNVIWITDQDAIAPNPKQLADLTTIFGQIMSHYAHHDYADLRVGTTASDPGDQHIEDIASIADLAAGALARSCAPGGGLVGRDDVNDKDRDIVGWLGQAGHPLHRVVLTMDKDVGGGILFAQVGFLRVEARE